MNNKTMGTAAVTGIALTMAAGTAAYMMSSGKKGKAQKKALKKNATKALRTVGSVIDNVSSMIGY